MLLTLTLHCIVCQEVSGLRTSRSKALQEAGPLSNCSQHRAQNWHSLSGFNLQAVHDNRSLQAWRLWFVATTPGHMPAMPGAPLSQGSTAQTRVQGRTEVGLSWHVGEVDTTHQGKIPGGSVDTTPSPINTASASSAPPLGHVVSTPSSSARNSVPGHGTHNSGNRCGECGSANTKTGSVGISNDPLVLHSHAKVDRYGNVKPPHVAHCSAQHECTEYGCLLTGTGQDLSLLYWIDPAAVAPSPVEQHSERPSKSEDQLMEDQPLTVTQALRRIQVQVCTSDPLPAPEAFAPLFADLDIAWRRTHSQELSTPAFIQHLSNYIMIQEGVAPSSQVGVSIQETVGSIARARLGLRINCGPMYGVEKPQDTSERVSATHPRDQPMNQTADDVQPSERLMALNMALETLERSLQPSAGLRQHLECISKTLSMSFKPAQVTRTRSAEWYAVFRTMALSSARLTNVGPADAFTDNHSTALQCTRRSVGISELSPSLPVEGHTGSQGSARTELRLVSATVAQKRKSPPKAQSEESARGPWGTLRTAWPRLQGQKSEHSADLYNMHSLPVYLANSTPALSTSCMSRHCKVKHRSNPAGRTDKSAPPATIVLGFPKDALPPSHAHPKPVEIQALNFSNTSASPSTRKEAGWSPAGLRRTDLAHKWVCASRSCKGLPNDTRIPRLPAHTGDTTSQKLSVAFHTADPAAGTPRTAMPSPSAKLKSSRRLPKYLRTSGAAPSGALAEARAEAEARYARGASNQHGQHSSVQGKRRQEAETENQQWRTASWYDSWYTQGWQSGWCSDILTIGRRGRLRLHRDGCQEPKPWTTSARSLRQMTLAGPALAHRF